MPTISELEKIMISRTQQNVMKRWSATGKNLTLNARPQSTRQMTSTVTCDQCQNQQLQHVQRPCLALSAAQFCVSPGLSKVEL